MINEIDKRILAILQENARTSNAEIARKVGLAPSAVFERIRKLEERRVIRGYRAEINPKVLGLAQLAFTFVRSNDRPGGVETGKKLAEIPEIHVVHLEDLRNLGELFPRLDSSGPVIGPHERESELREPEGLGIDLRPVSPDNAALLAFS